MTMGEAFPDVWLPRALDMRFAVAMAVGQFDMQYHARLPRLPAVPT